METKRKATGKKTAVATAEAATSQSEMSYSKKWLRVGDKVQVLVKRWKASGKQDMHVHALAITTIYEARDLLSFECPQEQADVASVPCSCPDVCAVRVSEGVAGIVSVLFDWICKSVLGDITLEFPDDASAYTAGRYTVISKYSACAGVPLQYWYLWFDPVESGTTRSIVDVKAMDHAAERVEKARRAFDHRHHIYRAYMFAIRDFCHVYGTHVHRFPYPHKLAAQNAAFVVVGKCGFSEDLCLSHCLAFGASIMEQHLDGCLSPYKVFCGFSDTIVFQIRRHMKKLDQQDSYGTCKCETPHNPEWRQETPILTGSLFAYMTYIHSIFARADLRVGSRAGFNKKHWRLLRLARAQIMEDLELCYLEGIMGRRYSHSHLVVACLYIVLYLDMATPLHMCKNVYGFLPTSPLLKLTEDGVVWNVVPSDVFNAAVAYLQSTDYLVDFYDSDTRSPSMCAERIFVHRNYFDFRARTGRERITGFDYDGLKVGDSKNTVARLLPRGLAASYTNIFEKHRDFFTKCRTDHPELFATMLDSMSPESLLHGGLTSRLDPPGETKQDRVPQLEVPGRVWIDVPESAVPQAVRLLYDRVPSTFCNSTKIQRVFLKLLVKLKSLEGCAIEPQTAEVKRPVYFASSSKLLARHGLLSGKQHAIWCAGLSATETLLEALCSDKAVVTMQDLDPAVDAIEFLQMTTERLCDDAIDMIRFLVWTNGTRTIVTTLDGCLASICGLFLSDLLWITVSTLVRDLVSFLCDICRRIDAATKTEPRRRMLLSETELSGTLMQVIRRHRSKDSITSWSDTELLVLKLRSTLSRTEFSYARLMQVMRYHLSDAASFPLLDADITVSLVCSTRYTPAIMPAIIGVRRLLDHSIHSNDLTLFIVHLDTLAGIASKALDIYGMYKRSSGSKRTLATEFKTAAPTTGCCAHGHSCAHGGGGGGENDTPEPKTTKRWGSHMRDVQTSLARVFFRVDTWQKVRSLRLQSAVLSSTDLAYLEGLDLAIVLSVYETSGTGKYAKVARPEYDYYCGYIGAIIVPLLKRDWPRVLDILERKGVVTEAENDTIKRLQLYPRPDVVDHLVAVFQSMACMGSYINAETKMLCRSAFVHRDFPTVPRHAFSVHRFERRCSFPSCTAWECEGRLTFGRNILSASATCNEHSDQRATITDSKHMACLIRIKEAMVRTMEIQDDAFGVFSERTLRAAKGD